MAWTPRSERVSGQRATYDGFPAHMHGELSRWMSKVDTAIHGGYYTENRLAATVALRAGIVFRMHSPSGPHLLEEAYQQGSDDKALDVIKGYLYVASEELSKDLRSIFAVSGHTLTVGPDLKSLVEVVDTAMSRLATEAFQPSDRASQELQEAWNNAYGRGPDPSDAWDHAIKAVEALIGPIVEPANDKSTLGTPMGVIRNDAKSKSPRWSATCLKCQTGESAHEAVLSVLGRIWANPDRHGSGTPMDPTLTQARAVVTLAVAVVQMAREGNLLS